MTEILYKPWENDSIHNQYDGANSRRIALFDQNIEGLQVKVKRTADGSFTVKTRIPVPPKPVAKKKTPPKKAASKKTTTRSRTTAKKTPAIVTTEAQESVATKKPAAKKRPTKKTSRKRK